MLDVIEVKLFDTPRSCELDKAWKGIQYCLGDGKWDDLRQNNLQELIRKNFWKIEDESFQYKDDEGLEHALGWSKGILSFYESALKGK